VEELGPISAEDDSAPIEEEEEAPKATSSRGGAGGGGAGGKKKQKRGKKGGSQVASSPPAPEVPVPKAPTASTAPTASSTKASQGRPFSEEEAIKLLSELHAKFSEASFQALVRRVEEKYPDRYDKKHQDSKRYSADIQAVALNVYSKVLARKPWSLPSGGLGVVTMNARMAGVAEHPKVIKLRAEIQGCMGFRGCAAEDPILVEAPDGSGNVPMYPLPLLVDCDGDWAHEFWEEDLPGGMLRRTAQATAASAA